MLQNGCPWIDEKEQTATDTGDDNDDEWLDVLTQIGERQKDVLFEQMGTIMDLEEKLEEEKTRSLVAKKVAHSPAALFSSLESFPIV